jgi:hypothetical protein
MTEAEWQSCEEPGPLLEQVFGRVSERKLRLFAVACCRQLWGASPDEATHVALSVAEHLAETGSLRVKKSVVRVASGQTVIDCSASEPVKSLHVRSEEPAWKRVPASALNPLLVFILEQTACGGWGTRQLFDWFITALEREGLSLARQAVLFRDIIPGFSRPLVFQLEWLRWNGGAVPGIAQAADDDRIRPGQELDPCRLAILADALEDAGCDGPELLGHLRGPGPHVPGCWPVDLILSKDR